MANNILILKPNKGEISYLISVNGLINSNWKTIENKLRISDFVKSKEIQSLEYSDILILPSQSEFQLLSNADCIITSRGVKKLIVELLQIPSVHIIEVEERINLKGDVTKSLSEPEINKVLRQVFAHRSKNAALLFLNGIINPIHSTSLKNILFTARIKSIIPKL